MLWLIEVSRCFLCYGSDGYGNELSLIQLIVFLFVGGGDGNEVEMCFTPVVVFLLAVVVMVMRMRCA